MRLFSGSRPLDADLYSTRAVDLLSTVFDQLREEPVRTVVLDAVRRQVANPGDWFEVILDDPIAANWRLRRHPERNGCLRVSDYRMFGTSPRPDVDTVNERLADLDSEMRGHRG